MRPPVQRSCPVSKMLTTLKGTLRRGTRVSSFTDSLCLPTGGLQVRERVLPACGTLHGVDFRGVKKNHRFQLCKAGHAAERAMSAKFIVV